MILYSIIIPVYNVEKYLKECLESVIHQSYKNWEAILVDDGSTDKLSAKICDEYSKKDKRFRVFHKENEGLLLTLRYGLRQADGDYILFIDSDDYVHKDLLITVDKIINQSQSDLVIFRFQRVGGIRRSNSPVVFKEGTVIGEGGLSKELLWKKVVSGCELNNLVLKVVKREDIDIDTDYSPYAFIRSGTDIIQTLPIFSNAKKIFFLEEILYYYRFNPNSISFSKRKQTDKKLIKAQLKSWEFIQDEKLKYLTNCQFASEENLKEYYKSCFIRLMEMMVSWLANESVSENRKWIMQEILKNKHIADGKKYLHQPDFKGIDKLLYPLAINGSNMLKIPLTLLIGKEKAISVLRNFASKISQLKPN